jgi:hypothetical protein
MYIFKRYFIYTLNLWESKNIEFAVWRFGGLEGGRGFLE